MGYYLVTKRINFCHLQQFGWPWGHHHAKWNKSEDMLILYDLTYMWNLSKPKQNKWAHRHRSVVARGREVGNGQNRWPPPEVRAFLIALLVNHLSAMRETQVQFLGWEDPLEKEMATHSSILAWKIPRKEEPGRLQSTGSQESDTT